MSGGRHSPVLLAYSVVASSSDASAGNQGVLRISSGDAVCVIAGAQQAAGGIAAFAFSCSKVAVNS